MREHVFLDTNILLDYIFERTPFFDDAVSLFQLRSEDKIEFYLSSLSLANLAYSIQRLKKDPRPAINVLLEWTHVIPLDRDVFLQTIPSKFADFEDGLQYFSAVTMARIDAIITRNKKDFAPSSIPVLTAGEYVVHHKQKF